MKQSKDLSREDFLKIISVYDPVEINELIKSKGKPPKLISPFIRLGELNDNNFKEEYSNGKCKETRKGN